MTNEEKKVVGTKKFSEYSISIYANPAAYYKARRPDLVTSSQIRKYKTEFESGNVVSVYNSNNKFVWVVEPISLLYKLIELTSTQWANDCVRRSVTLAPQADIIRLQKQMGDLIEGLRKIPMLYNYVEDTKNKKLMVIQKPVKRREDSLKKWIHVEKWIDEDVSIPTTNEALRNDSIFDDIAIGEY